MNNNVKLMINKKIDTKNEENIKNKNSNIIRKNNREQFDLLNSKLYPFNNIIKIGDKDRNINDMNYQMKLDDEKIIKQIIMNVAKNESKDIDNIKESTINKKVNNISGDIYEQEKFSLNEKINNKNKEKGKNNNIIVKNINLLFVILE